MSQKFRSNCPITNTLDILGDKWLFVIIKQILIENKVTFKDFIESEEAISTNILTAKLKFLEEIEIINIHQKLNNKKTKLYYLTDKGLSLTPIILEFGLWADKNLRNLNLNMNNNEGMALLRDDKITYQNHLINNYKKTRTDILNS